MITIYAAYLCSSHPSEQQQAGDGEGEEGGGGGQGGGPRGHGLGHRAQGGKVPGLARLGPALAILRTDPGLVLGGPLQRGQVVLARPVVRPCLDGLQTVAPGMQGVMRIFSSAGSKNRLLHIGMS